MKQLTTNSSYVRKKEEEHLTWKCEPTITKYSRKSSTKKKGWPEGLLNMKLFEECLFLSYIPATEKKREPTCRRIVCYLKQD
ncbi:hypothetical protein MRX96_050313 [Rhipicephalus microplus]